MEDRFFKCIQFLTLKDLVSFLHNSAKNATLDFLFMQGKTCSLDKLGKRDIFSDVA